MGFESSTIIPTGRYQNVFGQDTCLILTLNIVNSYCPLDRISSQHGSRPPALIAGMGVPAGEHRDRGMFYQIDSRFSMTAANSDKWLPVKPGWGKGISH
ncbi:MAG: hypothetical protein CM1200mP22_01980 [Dehalococcoidia bacterium]|nr:MAG: hypothetical protein CM1200mP22_01980 [Dehalococcoidia bacterium]